MNLQEFSTELTESFDLEVRDAGAGFFQLWDVNGDLLLHVRGWDFFLEAVNRTQGTIRMSQVECERTAMPSFSDLSMPLFWELAASEITVTERGIYVCVMDGEVIFAATSWAEAYGMLCEKYGTDLVAQLIDAQAQRV